MPQSAKDRLTHSPAMTMREEGSLLQHIFERPSNQEQ
jgi:hypothetical protein